jgi:ABC-type phosphate transport system ATPase subunit
LIYIDKLTSQRVLSGWHRQQLAIARAIGDTSRR